MKPTSTERQIASIAYVSAAMVISLPWFVFGYLFSADEYMHAYNACVLDEVLSGNAVFKEWFSINAFPEPNLAGHAVLLLLGKFLPLALVEKLFVLLLIAGNGYIFLSKKSKFAFGVFNSISSNSEYSKAGFALLALLLWLSSVWQLGFVNYLLGMMAMLVGLVHTAIDQPRMIPNWTKVLGWALVCYFCHPIAFLLFLGTVSLRLLIQEKLLTPWLIPLSGNWTRFLKFFALSFSLPLLLFVTYTYVHSEVSTISGASPWRLLGLVFFHNEIALFSPAELMVAKATVFTIVAGIALSIFGNINKLHAGLLSFAVVTAGVLLLAILMVPDYLVGGAFIHQRLMPILFIWGLWFAAIHGRLVFASTRRFALIIPILLGCSFTYLRLPVLGRVDVLFDDLIELAAEIPKGSSVLPVAGSGRHISAENQLSLKPVLHHFAGVIGCKRDIVLLSNYEAEVGYFPLHWKLNKNPFTALSKGLEAHPARLAESGEDWLLSNTNYILTLGALKNAVEPETLEWLSPHLVQVAQSKENYFKLYKIQDRSVMSKSNRVLTSQ